MIYQDSCICALQLDDPSAALNKCKQPPQTHIILYSFPILPPPPNANDNYNQFGDHQIRNNNAAQKKLQQTQAKVDEVVGIMRVNVEKVLERDQKLSELGERADQLEQGASQFEQQAGKLKRKQWWANMKMMIILGVIAVVLLIIVLGKLTDFIPLRLFASCWCFFLVAVFLDQAKDQ